MKIPLLSLLCGWPKTSKKGRMGPKLIRVGSIFLPRGVLIRRPSLHLAHPLPTRLLTRLFQEVWFPGHACHALPTSLFTSLFAGKREVAPMGSESVAKQRPAHMKRSGSRPGHFSNRPPQEEIPADLHGQAQGRARQGRFHQPPSSRISSRPGHLRANEDTPPFSS